MDDLERASAMKQAVRLNLSEVMELSHNVELLDFCINHSNKLQAVFPVQVGQASESLVDN
jgi:hypothetical protein